MKELRDELERLKKRLAAYREERTENKGILLTVKDMFRRSLYDPNSVNRRLQACLFLEQQIQSVIALGSKTPPSAEFNAATVELVTSLCAKIEENPDRASRQRQMLSSSLQPLMRRLSPVVTDQPTRLKLAQTSLRHMNFLLTDRIVEYQQDRLTNVVTSPLNWFSRAWDFVFPKARDKRMGQLNATISQLQRCEYVDDYKSFIKSSDATIETMKQTDKPLAELLTSIQAPIKRRLKQNSIPQRQTPITPESPKSDGHPLDDNMAYFEKRMRPQLTYQLLVHGLGSQGEFQREPGVLGHIGITIGNVGSLLPFGKVGGALVGQVLVFAEGQQQSRKDAALAEKIPHHVLDKVVTRIVEQLMHDMAGPISKLYYSPLYTRAMDKLVDRIVSNIVASLQEIPEIVLNDQHQQAIYKELIESRRKKGRLNAEEQHQLDSIHADILAKHAAAGVYKSFTRTPMAGWVTTTHLMHEKDENALFGGEGLNLFSIFEKPGRVVVNEDGSLQFFTGVDQRPDKYGYVFTTAEEVKKLGLIEDKYPDTDIIKYYQQLHEAYAVKQAVPQVVAEPAVKPQETVDKSEPASNVQITQQAEQLADKLKEIWQQLIIPTKKPFTNGELNAFHKELLQIKAEIKQNKSLKDTEVKLNEALFPLSTYVRLVEDNLNHLLKDQLDLLQQEQLAIKLTKNLVDQVAVTTTPIGLSLPTDQRPMVKVSN